MVVVEEEGRSQLRQLCFAAYCCTSMPWFHSQESSSRVYYKAAETAAAEEIFFKDSASGMV